MGVGRKEQFRVYRVTSPSHEALVVLGHDVADAVDLLVQFQALHGIDEVRFDVDPTWAASLAGVGREHIEQARDMCREPSIATRYRADEGWALGGPELDVSIND